MSKVKGDWTVSTIDGKSPADFAASLGLGEFNVQKNYSVTDSKFIFKTLNADGSALDNSEMDITVKSNGFEVMNAGSIFMSVTYDKDADTLSYKIADNSGEHTYVLKKGTSDIVGMYQAAVAAAQGGAAEGSEEGADEGGEDEYYEDDYNEESYGEDEYYEE